MPEYQFETLAGELVERWFSMADAPEIGSVVEDVDWGPIVRIPSSSPRRAVIHSYEHVASSLPRVHDPRAVVARRLAEAKVERDPIEREALLKSADSWSRAEKFWKNTTPTGKPVFTSKAQVEEFKARCGGRLAWSQD